MTIHVSFKNSKRVRRYRRKWNKHCSSAGHARVVRSFSEQWKRYPNCRNIIDLRSGAKTHTWIFPEGHDPTFSW